MVCGRSLQPTEMSPANIQRLFCIREHIHITCAKGRDKAGGAGLAPSEEHGTLDLGVVSSRPMLGIKIIYINKLKNIYIHIKGASVS